MRDTTRHGYPIIRREQTGPFEELIIADISSENKYHPFVVWTMSMQTGDCFWGSYCENRAEADEEFDRKLDRRRPYAQP